MDFFFNHIMLVAESVFVGIYCLLLYLIIVPVNYYTWFVLGFIKHYLSYQVGIQDEYCRHSYACGLRNVHASDRYLILDSLLEGVVFMIIGIIVNNTDDKLVSVATLGMTTHLLFEFIGAHHYFCQTRCSN